MEAVIIASENLADALRVADQQLSEARRIARNSNSDAEGLAAGIRQMQNLVGTTAELQRKNLRQELAAAKAQLASKRVQAQKGAKELDAALARVTAFRTQIAEHPAYRSALLEQHRLVDQVIELGARSLLVPIGEISSIRGQMSKIIDIEECNVAQANVKLRECGLPLLSPRIRRYIYLLTPSFVTDANVEKFRTETAEHARQLADF